MTGTVKKFLDGKGFGFITPDEGSDDVFFHQSEIQIEGFRTFEEGQRVDFDLEEGPKGLSAKQVKPI